MNDNIKKFLRRLALALLLFFTISLSSMILYQMKHKAFFQPYETLSYSDFYMYCKKRMVRNVVVHSNYMLIEVMFSKDMKQNDNIRIFKVIIPSQDMTFINDIKTYTNVSFVPVNKQQTWLKLLRFFINILPFIGIILYTRKMQDNMFSSNEDSIDNIDGSVVTLNNVVGFGSLKEEMLNLIRVWFYNSKFLNKKQDYIHTILFKGPPGTGKTYMAKVIAKTSAASLFVIDISKQGSAFIHQTSRNVQKVFDKAREIAAQKKVLIFLDEADSILQKRNSGLGIMSGDRENTEVVTTILRNISGIGSAVDNNILLVCATNNDINLDDAFHSRVAKSYSFGMLPYWERYEFIQFLIKNEYTDVEWHGNINLFAKLTYGSSQRRLKNIMLNAATQAKAKAMEFSNNKNKIATVNDEMLLLSLVSEDQVQTHNVTEESKMIIAMHEGCHLISMYLFNLFNFTPLSGIAILITAGKIGNIGGMAIYGVEDYSKVNESEAMITMSQDKKCLLSSVITSLSGKIGELMYESEQSKKIAVKTDASVLGWISDLNQAMESIGRLYLGGINFSTISNILFEMIKIFDITKYHIEIETINAKNYNHEKTLVINCDTQDMDLQKILENITNKKIIKQIKIHNKELNQFEHIDFSYIVNDLMAKNRIHNSKEKQKFYEKVLQSCWIVAHLIMYKYKNVVHELAKESCKNLLLHGEKLHRILMKA